MLIQNVKACSLAVIQTFRWNLLRTSSWWNLAAAATSEYILFRIFYFSVFILKCSTRAIWRSPYYFGTFLNLQLEVQLTVTLSPTAWFPLITADYLHPAPTASSLSHKEQENEALFYSCTGTTSATACRNIHIITIFHEENATGGRSVLIIHDICH